MRTCDFDYDLPSELIAQRPPAARSGGRLLHLDAASHRHDRRVVDLPGLARPGDLWVLNDTRVIPARMHGRRPSGGRVEVMVERILAPDQLVAQIGSNRRPAVGELLSMHARSGLEGGDDGPADPQIAGQLRVEGFAAGLATLVCEPPCDIESLLAAAGHVPLPPYVERDDDAADSERYQTVFAKRDGAVAAPTAGLHLDEALLAELSARGAEMKALTLHVGLGTFRPVRTDDPSAHPMHAERYELSTALAASVNEARESGRRIVAVGTTVVRALEAAFDGERVQAAAAETSIFMHPQNPPRLVDAMLTNFHLPRSTLLMLVCGFAGTEPTLAAYRHAVAQQYRFFSYGDAMFVERPR